MSTRDALPMPFDGSHVEITKIRSSRNWLPRNATFKYARLIFLNSQFYKISPLSFQILITFHPHLPVLSARNSRSLLKTPCCKRCLSNFSLYHILSCKQSINKCISSSRPNFPRLPNSALLSLSPFVIPFTSHWSARSYHLPFLQLSFEGPRCGRTCERSQVTHDCKRTWAHLTHLLRRPLSTLAE